MENLVKTISQDQNQVGLESGVEGLIKIINSNKTTSNIVANYTRAAFNDRLDILCSPKTEKYEEYREIAALYPNILQVADRSYDLVFVDLPKTTTDDSAIRVMEQADVIVCVVPQEIEKLNNLLKKINGIESIKDKQKIFVVGDYESGSRYNIFNLKLKYKIPEPCYVLPHNYLFTDACNDGNVLDFLYKNINAPAKDYNGEFILRATEIVEEIVKILKIKE